MLLVNLFEDKHGSLGIWDARAPQEEAEEDGDTSVSQREGGKYWRLQQHWPATSKSSISAIKLDPTNTHNVRSIQSLYKGILKFKA